MKPLFSFALTLVLLTIYAPAQSCSNTFGVLFGNGAPAANQCTSSTNSLIYVDTGGTQGEFFCQCLNGTATWIKSNSPGLPPIPPTLMCSPASLIFPTTNTNQSATAQNIACSNTSTNGATVTFTGVTLATGTQFSQTNNCGTLAPGASCNVSVTFTPTTNGALVDTLSIASNAAGSPDTVALAGTGQTPVVPTPSSVTISPASPAVGIGSTSNESATLVMSDSTTRPSGGSTFWNSATPANATISSSGVITGVATGTSVISANVGAFDPPNISEAHAGAGPFTTQVLPAFPSPNLAGNRILCAVMWGSATGSVSGITDTAGNSYSAIASTLEQANSNSVQWWTATGIAAQSLNVITVTWSGGGIAFPDPVCFEVQGDTAVDQAAVGTVASGTSVSTTAITPAQASETIFSAVITGNFVKAVNSGAFCIMAGGTGQTGLSGTCPISGAGSGIAEQGTFSTSAVTPSATLNAASNAVISAVALKTITGTTTATISNGSTLFTTAGGIPAGTNIYPTSPQAISGISSGPLFNTAIPSGATTFPLQHCQGNSSNCSTGDAIAKSAFTGNGNCTTNAADTATSGCGLMIIAKAQSSTDLAHPLYMSQSTDPWYTTGTACNFETPGLNATFQCTNSAQFSGSTTDQSISCYDQGQQLMFGGYAFNKGAGFSIGGPSTCGHAGTKADPCPLPGISACAINRPGTDPSWGSGNYSVTTPGNYTLGYGTGQRSAEYALTVRINELIAGNINHAVGFGVPCNASTVVFPASGVDLICNGNQGIPVSSTNPIYAGLYWCDYTTAQINAMTLPAWKSGWLKACATFGAYPVYTIGGQNFTGFQVVNTLESQTAYKAIGQTTSPLNALCSQSQIAICNTGSPSTALFETDIFNADIPLVQTVGSTSSDSSGRACNSAGGCDWTGHVHLLDQCVAKTMAGQPGGC